MVTGAFGDPLIIAGSSVMRTGAAVAMSAQARIEAATMV